MHDALRIIDANANRAREALRVMEDAARFALDDAALSREIKTLRHGLREALEPVADRLADHRDTPGDVGTQISTPTEMSRDTLPGVAQAAGKRLSEALRSIEEYAKLLDERGRVAPAVERLRYAGYTLEQRLNAALRPARPASWRVCLLLTETLCTHHPWPAVLEQALAAGVDCVQVREKDLPTRDLERRVSEVMRLVGEQQDDRARAVIVNDRADVAAACGADGVHLGQGDMSAAGARRAFGRSLTVGVSTSCLAEAKRAKADGADYCGVGPMFATTTKHKDHIVGPSYARAYADWAGLPGLAIGGITAGNASEVAATGVTGMAVSSAVCSAAEPGAAARALVEAISSVPR